MGVKPRQLQQQQQQQQQQSNPVVPKDWLDSEGRFKFGKYGPPYASLAEDVARKDPSYIRWILENVDWIMDEDRSILEAHLEAANRSKYRSRKVW